MVIDKNYFLSRLANGEDISRIGEDIADMMNEAVAEHTAMKEAEAKKAAEYEKKQAKRALVESMIENVKELAVLEGMDPLDLTIEEGEIDELVEAFTGLFQTLSALKKVVSETTTPTIRIAGPSVSKSDDEVLSNFIKNMLG